MGNNGNKTEKRAVKTVVIMMGATVIAKLLGMLRGVLQANAYGTSAQANAFTAASKLPLAFFDMFLAAAVLGCFIPIYNSFKEKDSKSADSEADNFACIFLNFIMLLCGVLALVGIVFARPFIGLITQGLDEYTTELAVTLTRIMFPLVIFTGAAYTLVGVLQSKGSFIAPALISATSNAGVVIYLAVFNRMLGDKGIYGLTVAYLLSWLIQLMTLVVPLWRKGFKYKLILNFKNEALRRAIKMAPPIMVGSWLAPAGILLGQFFAAHVASSSGITGATTVFDYANNIYVIIAGTLTYSICNYTFPKISKMIAEGETERFSATVRTGLVSAMLIIVPFMSAALVLAGEGTAIIYMRGAFTAEDAYNTARTLRFILAAMPAFCVIELFSRVFYSLGQPRVPMFSAIAGIIANIAVGSALTSAELFDIVAVGISNAAGQAVCAIVLIVFALKRTRGLLTWGFVKNVFKIAVGGAIVFVICSLLSKGVSSTPFEASFLTNLIKSLIIFIPSAAAYLVYTKLVRIRFGE